MMKTDQMKKQISKAKASSKAPTVDQLKKQIADLTDRVPSSADPGYLAQRLATLLRRKESGEDVRHRASGSAAFSVSLPADARGVVDDIIGKEKVSASKLVRQALALWASKHGYRDEARVLEGDTDA